MIRVENLSFLYGSKKALDQVSFEIGPGFNVLLGPNGAGKSTLVSLLTCLYRASIGEILINNHRLDNSIAKANAMKTFGVVFQQPTLDLDLTIKQNLVYHGALHGLSSKQSLENASEMLTALEIAERLDDKVRSLNGGHRRRVEIIRALIHQPRLLLLDEASVGLDPASRALILEHTRELARRDDICVLWATHLFDEINDDDNVIILNRGRLQLNGVNSRLCDEHKVKDISALFEQLINGEVSHAN